MTPRRIQRKRVKGWRLPEGAVYVGRPSRWGNWYTVVPNRIVLSPESVPKTGRAGPHWTVVATDKNGWETGPQFAGFADKEEATAFAVELYRRSLNATYFDVDGPLHREHYLGALRGHDLACWCPLDQPCHADVLLDLANRPDR